jgi:serine/threonine protein kinase
MVLLTQILHGLDMYLGSVQSVPEHVVSFRDMIEAATKSKDTTLELFLEKKETDDWEEAARCFLLSTEQYLLLRQAGEGSFGSVYKAFDREEQGLRAVKFLDRGDGAKVHDAYTIFGTGGLEDNERLADKFRHENIVKYYGRRPDGALVFEWIEGTSLDKIERFSPKEAEEIIKQVCQGVAHMHANGYAYNDLRFPNVMRSKKGKKNLITLLDYSIATLLDERGISTQTGNLSSREIAAPESILRGELSVRTDVWAIGQLMYRLFTGEHAFPHQNKDQLKAIVQDPRAYHALQIRITQHARIPKRYKKVIAKCLSYYPQARYHDVEQIITAIEPQGITLPLLASVGALALLGCGTALCSGAYTLFKEPEVVTIPAAPELTYSTERKVRREPRVAQGEDPQAPCNNPERYGFRNERYKETKEYKLCIEYRSAEALLDKGDFVSAARDLELIRNEFPDQHEPLAGLLEAYYELGLLVAADDVRKEIIAKHPEQNPFELFTYGDKVMRELPEYPTSLSFSSREFCTLDAVAKPYPECSDLVITAALPPEQKKAEYKKLKKKYPKSFLVEREYARFLFAQVTYHPVRDAHNTFVGANYTDLETVNEALAAYQHAGVLVKSESPFLDEIAQSFLHFDDWPHRFVFAYRASHVYDPSKLISFSEQKALRTYASMAGEAQVVLLPRIPLGKTVDEEYAVIVQHCMGEGYKITNCK